MTNMIPPRLHADLSPLLVQAAEWPEASELTPVPTAEEVARGARGADAGQERALLATLEELVHPALWAPASRRRLHWSAGGALYYRLRPAASDAAHAGWTGWASWAPCGGPVRAFCVYARAAAPVGPADRPTLDALLALSLAPSLAAEARAARARPAPSVQGPDDYAIIHQLDAAGYGAAYSLLYAYTNGQRVVAAAQPLVHEPM